MAKQLARKRLKALLGTFSDVKLRNESDSIAKWLQTAPFPPFCNKTTSEPCHVALYMNMPTGEVITTNILKDLLLRKQSHGDVSVYVPFIENVKTSQMTFVEVVSSDDLEQNFLPNKWNILEPTGGSGGRVKLEEVCTKSTVVTALVPGLGFDLHGNRLGRGKGFYDRYLQNLRSQCGVVHCVGLALSCSVLDEVPTDEFDVKMDWLATGNGLEKCTAPVM
eukprot:TRINITY_DN67091_c5_g17_i1.p1 TRINITY_DN67091_c5_g17~~TRINITY_DN67091_c5_g17_i1.p1  ORF type:complete len:221 (+),score=6.07 TRINITY_DN67091_c5_g17_i1:138-800(+)